jgi:hypothetical protein
MFGPGMSRLCFLLVLLATSVPAQNLLVNGDFEQNLSVGWIYTRSAGASAGAIRDTEFQTDPDWETADSLVYQGWSKLEQVVNAPGANLTLRFSARFAIGNGTAPCWPIACVTIGYFDGSDELLGETRFIYHDTNSHWTSTPTFSVIEVADPNWNEYTLDVADEFARHLPGIDPGTVGRIGVALFDSTSGG